MKFIKGLVLLLLGLDHSLLISLLLQILKLQILYLVLNVLYVPTQRLLALLALLIDGFGLGVLIQVGEKLSFIVLELRAIYFDMIVHRHLTNILLINTGGERLGELGRWELIKAKVVLVGILLGSMNFLHDLNFVIKKCIFLAVIHHWESVWLTHIELTEGRHHHHSLVPKSFPFLVPAPLVDLSLA